VDCQLGLIEGVTFEEAERCEEYEEEVNEYAACIEANRGRIAFSLPRIESGIYVEKRSDTDGLYFVDYSSGILDLERGIRRFMQALSVRLLDGSYRAEGDIGREVKSYMRIEELKI